MGKKKPDSSLGRTLIKDRFSGKVHRQKDSHLHTSELNDGLDWNRLNLQSVTEQNTLDEFLATAEIAGTEFQAERLNVQIVSPEGHTGLPTAAEERATREKHDQHRALLRIPRRPAWTTDTTASELDRAERDSFLEWRRQLAELQEVEGIVMTPFERNLEFWRQLWRVIERSDVVVQIVDARNPLLFRCADLESYIQEISKSKINMILCNKADHLTDKQRQMWAEYFDSVGVKLAFWSAVLEAEKLAAKDSDSSEEDVGGDDDDDWETEEEEEEVTESSSQGKGDSAKQDTECNAIETGAELAESSDNSANTSTGASGNTAAKDSTATPETTCKLCDENSADTVTDKSNVPKHARCFLEQKNSAELLGGEELVDLFKSLHDPTTSSKGITTIGMVGYPNVGKSSTINALLQTKKVPVSATPGRTKHFQTLFLDSTLMLCDCPGLVMPSFVTTKAQLVINGVLPVDQMRDYIPPVSLICRYIPREVLEATYGILLPRPRVEDGEDPERPPTAHELLTTHACMRGYMTHKGIPDYPRASRLIIKDYINGRLLYCHPPEAASVEEFQPAASAIKVVKFNKMAAKTAERIQPSSLDAEFFQKKTVRMGSMGLQGVTDFARRTGFQTHQAVGAPSGGSEQRLSDKSWRQRGNMKEKLRKVYKYLDA